MRQGVPGFVPPRAWEQVRTLSHEFASGHRIPPHSHGWHQLVHATTGVMTVHTPEGAWVVPAHRGVWVPADVEHWIEISGRVAMRTLYVRPAVSRSLPVRCLALNVPPLLRELILHAVEIGTLDRRVRAHVRLLGVILDQLGTIEDAALHLPEPRDPRAQRLSRIVHDDPSDRRTLAELARGTGASKRTLERLFQAETGMSFSRWRRQLRFVEALRSLAAGAKVTGVALDAGYDSLSAFVSAFRRVFGVTPGRYFRTAPSEL
ncbi:helix-turn-helix transcriptional regulator [bacterium]|nr:helix-turn-helix transcriptional regulator [bacterium]